MMNSIQGTRRSRLYVALSLLVAPAVCACFAACSTPDIRECFTNDDCAAGFVCGVDSKCDAGTASAGSLSSGSLSSGATSGGTASTGSGNGQPTFVGKWTGSVVRTCSEAGMDCSSSNSTLNLDITGGGSQLSVVMPGTYASTDPPGPTDCQALTLSVSGNTASITSNNQCQAGSGGPTFFTTYNLTLVSATDLTVDIVSTQQVNPSNVYNQSYQGTLHK